MAKDKKNIGKNTFKRFEQAAIEPIEKPKKTRNKSRDITKQETVKYSLNIDAKQLEQIKDLSAKTGISIKKLVGEALEDYLSNHWNPGKLKEFLDWKEKNPRR